MWKRFLSADHKYLFLSCYATDMLLPDQIKQRNIYAHKREKGTLKKAMTVNI
jgi:hypothetical protein